MRYWQQFHQSTSDTPREFWHDTYDAPISDGTILRLPLRDLGETAVAGLIVNQASFSVVDRLCGWMAVRAARHAPEIVVGMPTLGHVMAAGVARTLGHENWAPLGSTRKIWYDDALSVPLSSITSPVGGRRLWLDPRLVRRIVGRRVLLVDDVISSGSSILAGLALLGHAGVIPVAVCAAMLQGDRWRAHVPTQLPVCAAFATPIFARTPQGWRAIAGTTPTGFCT